MGELRTLIVVASSLSRRFIRELHFRFAGWWPHGEVDRSPAATGEAMAKIARWMKIPWFATGVVIQGTTRVNPGVPMSDKNFREYLKDPFNYHQSAGRQDGLLTAIQILGYHEARYMEWYELEECPTWTPPGASVPVQNQNAFGILCPNFPGDWKPSQGLPAAGTPIDTLMAVINQYKRASARLCELRVSYLQVVTQTWWDGPRDPNNVQLVRSQSSTNVDPIVVIDPTP